MVDFSSSPINISVSIVDDEKMAVLNKKYREKEGTTDVLSFNMDQKTDDVYYLGDVVISKDQAERQSAEYGNSLEEEIAALVEHGVLHLLGVHHD